MFFIGGHITWSSLLHHFAVMLFVAAENQIEFFEESLVPVPILVYFPYEQR